MWAKPTKQDLAKMPKLGETDKEGNATTIVQGHFFLEGNDWFVTEYDPVEELFYGFAILNSDYQMAEWGCISYQELKDLKMRGMFEVDYDKYWTKTEVQNVEKIKLGNGVY